MTSTPAKSMLRIANAQAFWGDTQLGSLQLVQNGELDYLTFDYLAEVTMSILQKQKSRDPEAGFARDFIPMFRKILPDCHRKGIRIIANAGGLNAKACMEQVVAVIRELGLSGIRVARVEGDDILGQLSALREAGEDFVNSENGTGFDSVQERVTSASVYIGAAPIVEALQQGADIVITGRASDPSLVLAPLIYEFGWAMDDYDKLAAGTILGHVIECGTQCTGGNYTRWRDVPDFNHIGFPVVEAAADGSFVVTKQDNTGGLVNVDTVVSQLLYELGDPENFLGPDCTADFTSIDIEQLAPNRVRLSGMRGKAPTDTYKVSMTYHNGYKILATLSIAGPDAIDKAHVLADMLFARMAMHGVEIPQENRFLELLGSNVLYKGLVPTAEQPHEILMRIGAKGDDRRALDILGTEVAPLLTAGPPGVTGYAGGRARATDVISYWPTLIDKQQVSTQVFLQEV